ncbi:hypothetical protein V1264_016976 [Littorina saxatilis]|uniref:Apple domain-containing protein n=1 Tax=Littorina saxatilis TaxID=31220 RepID=A0AAN9GEQ5_9CAEN
MYNDTAGTRGNGRGVSDGAATLEACKAACNANLQCVALSFGVDSDGCFLFFEVESTEINESFTFSSVVICATETLTRVEVRVYLDDIFRWLAKRLNQRYDLCYEAGTLEAGTMHLRRCKEVLRGRYVNVIQDASDLVLCEVEVMARPLCM